MSIAPFLHRSIHASILGLAIVMPQQPRDNTAAGRGGTATIAGTVIADDAAARPIRKALVSIAASGQPAATLVVTDDNGRFEFSALAAGRYDLTASKPSYLNASYGAARPGRAGSGIELAAGQRMTGLTIRMARGAVVTGAIVDPSGEPLPSARVTLMRYVFSPATGERALQPSGAAGTTDDRGVYRIFGIPPGEYVAQLSPPFSLPGELRQTTAQSFDAAMQAAREGGTSPGSGNPVQGPAVSYASIFYPGTPVPANAAAIALAPGETRSGIDMQLQQVPTAKVEGVVLGPDGAPAPNAQVSIAGDRPTDMSMPGLFAMMLGGGRPKFDGTFTLPGIAPGHYIVSARSGDARGGPAEAPPAVLWATADVNVNGQDVTGLRLVLAPGLTVSGRVVFDGTRPRPADLSAIRVGLTPLVDARIAASVPPSAPDANGRFTIRNLVPGRYRLAASGVAGWSLRSAQVNGADALDTGLDVRANESVTDAVLTFSDRSTALSGTLTDPGGRPASDYFIVVYATDPAFWAPPSRRIAMARPGSDGRFTVRDLPAGDYLVAAVTDAAPGEWMDPAFLRDVVSASIKVSLADGETRTQDIRIAGR